MIRWIRDLIDAWRFRKRYKFTWASTVLTREQLSILAAKAEEIDARARDRDGRLLFMDPEKEQRRREEG